MASKRMLTRKVTDDDNFTALSSSAQALYLHLSMNADDDGFCNQLTTSMFRAHASVQDLQALLEKRYIYQFESGVIVIKHWRMANALRKDRYSPTDFQEELAQLKLKPNGSYTWNLNNENIGLPDGCQEVAACLPQNRIDKNRIDKNRIDKNRIDKNRLDKINNISNTNVLDCPTSSDSEYIFPHETNLWNELEPYGIVKIRGITSNSKRATLLRARLKQYGEDSFKEIIEQIKNSDFLQGKHSGKPWQITFDWMILPNNYPKVLEGNYRNGEHIRRGYSQLDDIDVGE